MMISFIYLNRSNKPIKGAAGCMLFDCTNFYFKESGEGCIGEVTGELIRDTSYGVSKEHRPNPIVRRGRLSWMPWNSFKYMYQYQEVTMRVPLCCSS